MGGADGFDGESRLAGGECVGIVEFGGIGGRDVGVAERIVGGFHPAGEAAAQVVADSFVVGVADEVA